MAAADLIPALLVVALAGSPSPAAPELVWAPLAAAEDAGELRVEGLASAALARLAGRALDDGLGERLLRVVAAPPGDDDAARLPNLWGSYRVDGGALVFRPRHALGAGVELQARFDGAAFDAATGARGTPNRTLRRRGPAGAALPTSVVAVAPSGDEIPANLLRLYVEFSAPMSLRDVADAVQLLDANGAPISDAFVAVPEGLWDPERRRLTLLVHPGRIKRGVGPGEALGPVLREGERVRLVVGAGARDANGRPLAGAFERDFRVGPPLVAPLDLAMWSLVPPSSPDAPVVVISGVPLDRGLALRAVGVLDAAGAEVAGALEVALGERSFSFRPAQPWRDGERYRLFAGDALEDPAGNRVGRAFDRAVGASRAPGAAEVEFVPRFAPPVAGGTG